MADSLVTNWTDFLYELRGPMQINFPKKFVLMAEIDRITRDSGPNQNREQFSGNQVRVPISPVWQQGGGFATESSTWNVPINLQTSKVTISMARYVLPMSISPDLQFTSMDNSAAQALAHKVKMARIGAARDENTALNGDGTGLVATVTGGSTGSLTIIFGSTAAPANADELAPGRVVDILTRSNGADPGSGKRRLISTTTDNGDGTVTVVFSTTAQASDGGSGNITFGVNEGAYLPGSYGNVSQGLQQALATSGTFEGLDKGANGFWQGTDGRSGVTTQTPLTTSMLDGCVRKLWGAGVDEPDFWIGDPGVIDLYKQGLYTQSRWAGQTGTLATGFSGVSYNQSVLIGEHQHKRGSISGVNKGSIQMYGFQPGPDFLQDDGSIKRRFNRTLLYEVDLVDWYQMGFLACNTHVFANNLSRAA